jgi:hypothetical protein
MTVPSIIQVPFNLPYQDLKLTFNQENSAAELRWIGSTIPYIFSGTHRFIFGAHSSGDLNKTQFSQYESFTGLLSPLSFLLKGTVTASFEKVDQDLEAEAEKRWQALQQL